MRTLTGLILILLFQQTLASETPEATAEATLNKYFDILTGQDFAGIAALMDTESMMQLKATMDDAIGYQANHGVYRLQRRIFGRKVSMSDVDAATADFYLESLAGEILEARASLTGFVHFLALLKQNTRQTVRPNSCKCIPPISCDRS